MLFSYICTDIQLPTTDNLLNNANAEEFTPGAKDALLLRQRC